MIPSIHIRLLAWADWCIRGRKVKGLGFPAQSPFMRLTPGCGCHSPEANEEAWLIEKTVHKLPRKHIRLVREFYLHTGTADAHAKQLRISRSTLYEQLAHVHWVIDRELRS